MTKFGAGRKSMGKGALVLGAFIGLAAVVAGVEMFRMRSRAMAEATVATEAAQQAAQEAPTRVAPSARPHRVVAYYFHTTVRCTSCRAIEAYSQEAIASAFAEEIKDGRLVWRVVNIEVPGNEHFIQDYQLYTKSLVIVHEVQGERTEWKNLEKVWQLVQDKPRFVRYVQDEMRGYLKESS